MTETEKLILENLLYNEDYAREQYPEVYEKKIKQSKILGSKILDQLKRRGAYIYYSDPLIPKIPKMRKYSIELESESITAESLKIYDLIILATDHDLFDYEMIERNSKLIVDTRGRYSDSSVIFRG